MSRLLTIGMLTYDDFDGVWFTVQAIRMFHPEILNEIEFLILDNNPESKHGRALHRIEDGHPAGFVTWVKEPIRCLPVTDCRGTALRTRLFDLAKTPYVLCLDCHVLLAPGSLRRLIDFMDAEHDNGNLLHGPMLADNHNVMATHMAPVWREGMLGIWAIAWKCPCGTVFQTAKIEREEPLTPLTDFKHMLTCCSVGACPSCGMPFPVELAWYGHERILREKGYTMASDGDAPFEIPAHGLGAFACRKDAWLGFNDAFRGFGGEECYIHEKFRQSGRATLCLPWFKWLHRFERPAGAGYPNLWEDRIHNYMVGHAELGLDTQPVRDHFAKLKVLPAA